MNDNAGVSSLPVAWIEHPARKKIDFGAESAAKYGDDFRFSSVWETPSVGSSGPDFLNLAVLITTPLKASELKAQVLLPLEKKLGRVRSANKNAPRTFDIDIILFDGQLLDPNLWVYAHRAVPVAEILPDYRSGQGKLLKEVARELSSMNPIRLKRDVLVDSQILYRHTNSRSNAREF